MTLRITLPASGFDIPIEMHAGDDGEEFNNHVLREGAGLEPEYVEPYVTAKETLWLIPGIDNIVRGALKRMEKAFAYNLVYFLKVILDLQVTYLGLNSAPAPDAVLDTKLVLRIAELMAGRMARRDKDNNSPSRELQLRTLISALSLLYQVRIERLGDYTYAKLLKDVSERDSDNKTKSEEGNHGKPSNGDVGFLVRYACDLIRCLPSDLPDFNDSSSQAINVHFLFAAGFINQLDGETTPAILDKTIARIKAPPSEWHKDMRHLYEGTAGAISLHHQSFSKNPTRTSQYAGNLAAEVTRSIVEKTEQELEALSSQDPVNGLGARVSGSLPKHEVHLLISGLLDLLSQLVAAFKSSEDIQREARSLSMKIIHNSDRSEFRNKAFEIIISSTLGCTEAEYYAKMRDLDLAIDQYFGMFSGPEVSDERVLRMEELKIEKRDAMDRCEKRAILYKGAVESMQRRIQTLKFGGGGGGGGGGGEGSSIHSFGISQTVAEVMRLTTCGSWVPMDDGARSATTASPVPSSIPTCDSLVSLSIVSPAETCALLGPTDTPFSPMSRLQTYDSPTESPILPHLYQTPHLTPRFSCPAPGTPQEAITPNSDATLRFDRLDQLFAESIFDEPEDYLEDMSVSESSLGLPIQNFNDKKPAIPVYIRRENLNLNSEEFHTFRNSSESIKPLSFISQILVEPPEPSPKSTYPEPSLSRTPSSYAQIDSSSRHSRASRIFGNRTGFVANREAPRSHTLQLNKPLPPLNKRSVLADDLPGHVIPDAPPVIIEPIRSHSSMEMRSENQDYMRMRSSSALGHNRSNSYEPMMPVFSGVESVPIQANSSIQYESPPDEEVFKVQPKDSCLSVFISSDAKHVVYLSPHAFQVFGIPRLGEPCSPKPIFSYRLGESEGLRKGKVPWAYKSGSASEKYVVTVTKDRVQVHDLEQACKVIFTESTKGWENSCVAIAADKLAVGLSKTLRGENVGMIRIFKMNAPTYPGIRCEKLRDMHLPINRSQPPDAPHILSISGDGNYLTCGTPKHGYYFSWDMSRVRTAGPVRIATGRLKVTNGHGSEMLSTVTLFPNTKHILCSTFPKSSTEAEWNGCFIEPIGPRIDKPLPHLIRQVGLRVTHAAIAPLGNAAAFLTKSGTIWMTQVSHLEGDENLTTFAPTQTRERLQNQQLPETAGRVIFTPEGDRLVAVDRKGKIIILTFRKIGLSPIIPPSMKLEVGGFF